MGIDNPNEEISEVAIQEIIELATQELYVQGTTYAVNLCKKGEMYEASVDCFADCRASGKTQQEAMENIKGPIKVNQFKSDLSIADMCDPEW